MAYSFRWLVIISSLMWTIICKEQISIITANYTRLPVVFVYTVDPYVCNNGLPVYIKVSLEQAIEHQPDCDVILLSNYDECPQISILANTVNHLIKLDVNDTMSTKTRDFIVLSSKIFQQDNPLWVTSALRFFYLEDLMVAYNYRELIHIEADNMLYGKMTSILEILRKDYIGIAATPLTARKTFITASVFWVANLGSLRHFNDYLYGLGSNTMGQWSEYSTYMKIYHGGKKGGVDPDQNGVGIKPYAINEMSMMGFYKVLHPQKFYFFPVVPVYNYYINRHTCNMSDFQPGGKEIGALTSRGIFDPNSWGQLLGGTSSGHGRDIGFNDAVHIVGQALRLNPSCLVTMMCSNMTLPQRNLTLNAASHSSIASHASLGNTSSSDSSPSVAVAATADPTVTSNIASNQTISLSLRRSQLEVPSSNTGGGCYTAPFVRCNESDPWTPLWNLHVHSKQTEKFRSVRCQC